MKKIAVVLSFLSGILLCSLYYKNYHSFPHFKNKHQYKSILTPTQFLDYKTEKGQIPSFSAPKTLILCYDNHLLKSVLSKYKHQQCDGAFSNVCFLSDYPSVAIAKFGLFGGLNAFRLELAIAWGVKQVIAIGTSCALQKGITQKDIIVCEKSIRDEGTSYHYLPYGKYAYPSKKLQKKLLLTLKQLNQPYKIGTSWTTDAFFRATKEEVAHYQKEGVLCIEAEAASVFSVAKFRNIEMVVMLTVTDSYANLKWEKAVDYQKQKLETLNTMLKIALKVSDEN